MPAGSLMIAHGRASIDIKTSIVSMVETRDGSMAAVPLLFDPFGFTSFIV